jgi:hypothetical protein
VTPGFKTFPKWDGLALGRAGIGGNLENLAAFIIARKGFPQSVGRLANTPPEAKANRPPLDTIAGALMAGAVEGRDYGTTTATLVPILPAI